MVDLNDLILGSIMLGGVYGGVIESGYEKMIFKGPRAAETFKVACVNHGLDTYSLKVQDEIWVCFRER